MTGRGRRFAFFLQLWGLVVASGLGSGCQSSFGPQALEQTHPAYNQALINSMSQQMLLNLVRLKYRDNPYFLEVGSVTASLSLAANVGVNAKVGLGSGSDTLEPNLGVTYSQVPTISYSPLQGADFLQRIHSPISVEALLAMTQSGWSIERVFGLCLERINDLLNAPSASGPTPDRAPQYQDFKRALSLLRRLQVAHRMQMGIDTETKQLVIQLQADPDYQAVIDELLPLLGMADQKPPYRFKISTNFLDTQQGEWDVRVRSIAGVLFYLSQNIEVPDEHRAAGLITQTKLEGEGMFDWSDTPGGAMMKVHVSDERPTGALLAVPYRGAWFYIADDDLQSKSTFMLIQQLFNLQSGQVPHAGPTLTLPVGGG